MACAARENILGGGGKVLNRAIRCLLNSSTKMRSVRSVVRRCAVTRVASSAADWFKPVFVFVTRETIASCVVRAAVTAVIAVVVCLRMTDFANSIKVRSAVHEIRGIVEEHTIAFTHRILVADEIAFKLRLVIVRAVTNIASQSIAA